jgi:outer membrane protein TolC
LAELIATALRTRANLHARQSDIAAAEEVPSRVGSPPDPTFVTGASNLRIDDPTLDASAMSGITLGLTQAIPFPGKLHLRAEAARATTRVLERVLTSEQARVALAVERAYWELWLAQESVRILSETERVLDMLSNAVVARFSVGEAAQQDALRCRRLTARSAPI